VNIGDIGHTPGALSLLEKYFPEAEITLWPGSLGHGSRQLLTQGYPRLKIVALTAFPAGRAPARDSVFDAYITKPVEPTTLVDSVARALRE
jgi:hypothetical protein